MNVSFSKISPLIKGDERTFWRYFLGSYEPTQAMLFGTAVHAMALENKSIKELSKDLRLFSAKNIGFDNFKTKCARDERDKLLEDGYKAVDNVFFEYAQTCADNVKEALKLFKDFETEKQVSGNWLNHQWTGRADIIGENFVADLKVVGNLKKTIKDIIYGSNNVALQCLTYGELMGLDNPKYYVLLAEAVAPFRCAVIELESCCAEKIEQALISFDKLVSPETYSMSEQEKVKKLEELERWWEEEDQKKDENFNKTIKNKLTTLSDVAWYL